MWYCIWPFAAVSVTGGAGREVMLLTQVLLMLLSVLTEAELNWQRGGRHIKLSVCVCGREKSCNWSASATRPHQAVVVNIVLKDYYKKSLYKLWNRSFKDGFWLFFYSVFLLIISFFVSRWWKFKNLQCVHQQHSWGGWRWLLRQKLGLIWGLKHKTDRAVIPWKHFIIML